MKKEAVEVDTRLIAERGELSVRYTEDKTHTLVIKAGEMQKIIAAGLIECGLISTKNELLSVDYSFAYCSIARNHEKVSLNLRVPK